MLNTRHGRSRSTSHSNLLGLVTVLALSCTACGGSDNNSSNNNGTGGATGAPTTIHGGERLTWDQAASSLQEARGMEYRLYVDNAQSSFSDVRCDTSSTGFQCSGVLPSMSAGRHTLELTAVLSGVESPRSSPFTVSLNVVSQATQDSSKRPNNSNSGAAAAPTCTGTDCLNTYLVASGLNGVSAVTAAPDGRVFFIVGDDSIGVIADGRVQSESALQLHDGGRLVGLALDAQFSGTRSVFVAIADSRDSGTSSLRVVRYREVQGTLGEGATIVNGLPMSGNATVPLSVDADGLLYIALPAATSSDLSGRILRLTRAGGVPAGSSTSSPVLTAGYPVPTSLMVDSNHSRLWLSGRANGSQQTTSMPLAPVSNAIAAAGNSLKMSAAQPQGRSVVDHAAAVAAGVQPSGESGGSLLVVADGQLQRATLTSDGLVARTDPIRASFDQPVIAATTGRAGSIYAATGTTDGPVSIWLLKSR